MKREWGDSARGVRVGGKNPKNVWWNDVVKTVWKEVLGPRDGFAKDRCREIYKEEKRDI